MVLHQVRPVIVSRRHPEALFRGPFTIERMIASSRTTDVDGIVDLPSLRDDVLITNLHGIHGAAVSEEAAIMLMLAVSHDLPPALRNWPPRERGSGEGFRAKDFLTTPTTGPKLGQRWIRPFYLSFGVVRRCAGGAGGSGD